MNIIYYDGRCALCHAAVRIVLKLDNKQLFKLSPLSLIKTNQKEFPNTIILNLNGNLYYEGEAVRKILENLNFFGRILSLLAKITPLYLLNFFYKIIAKNRNIWIRKNKSQCPLVPKHLKDRFILYR
tara:strand:- start:199 stop:579 length:381 start_codon:yes stop_codon:yes gene_type:complete